MAFALQFQHGTLKTLQKGSLRFLVTHLRKYRRLKCIMPSFLTFNLCRAEYSCHGISVLPLVIYTRSHRKWIHLASNETTDTTTISEAERTHKLSAQRGEDTDVLHDSLSLGVSADSKPYWMIRQHSLFDERDVFSVDTVHLISL